MKLRVKELCKSRGVTMQQVADIMGINRVSLSNSLNGNPTLSTLENIATALEVEVVELFDNPKSNHFRCPNCGADIEVTLTTSKE